MRKPERLFELRGDEKYGRPLLGRFDDELMDAPSRANVDAATRLIKHNDARTNEDPFRHQHFLLVAAGIVHNRAVHRVGTDFEMADELLGASPLEAFR